MDMFTKSGDMWNGFGSLVELGGIKHGIQNHQTLTEIEQDYIWINIAWLHFLKKLDISYTAMEGWLITYIYGPLMSILMNIPNSALKMTEYKGSGVGKKYKTPALAFKHDGILYLKESQVDLMVMEAKPI
ncbi:hypothetical protein BGX31_001635 [Mortierella sp. GBA43]|nr:hypothetical protein BGX31_001635 [Mortierella sp. GBA43]